MVSVLRAALGVILFFEKISWRKGHWNMPAIQSTEWSLNGDWNATVIHLSRHRSVAIQPPFSRLKDRISSCEDHLLPSGIQIKRNWDEIIFSKTSNFTLTFDQMTSKTKVFIFAWGASTVSILITSNQRVQLLLNGHLMVYRPTDWSTDRPPVRKTISDLFFLKWGGDGA